MYLFIFYVFICEILKRDKIIDNTKNSQFSIAHRIFLTETEFSHNKKLLDA